jgi:prolyl oligopeptidase PreP (S9A serine peptidase family)
MAKKNVSGNNSEAWKNTVFVSYKLTKEDKVVFEKWSSRNEAEVALDVATFMSSGAKTSITWDTTNNVWIVAATMKEETNKSYNECISSRSDDWYEALRMNAFKALVLCKNAAWSSLSEGQDWG